jgi:hypothetical protein
MIQHGRLKAWDMRTARLDISRRRFLEYSWPSTWLTVVCLGLKIAFDFGNEAINILARIARLHVEEVSHRFLALALCHPGLLDQFFKHNFSPRARFDNSFLQKP